MKALLYSLLGSIVTAQATGFCTELTSRQTSVSLALTAQALVPARSEPSTSKHSG